MKQFLFISLQRKSTVDGYNRNETSTVEKYFRLLHAGQEIHIAGQIDSRPSSSTTSAETAFWKIMKSGLN